MFRITQCLGYKQYYSKYLIFKIGTIAIIGHQTKNKTSKWEIY